MTYDDYTLSQLMTKGIESPDQQEKFNFFEIQDSILSAQCIIDKYLVKIERIPCGQLGSGKRIKSLDIAHMSRH